MAQFIAPRPRNTQFTVRASKPRNPLVGPSLMRQAGSHAGGNERQRARRDLQKQLAEVGEHSP